MIATRRTSPWRPTAREPMAIAAGPAINFKTIPITVKLVPQTINFSWSAMNIPVYMNTHSNSQHGYVIFTQIDICMNKINKRTHTEHGSSCSCFRQYKNRSLHYTRHLKMPPISINYQNILSLWQIYNVDRLGLYQKRKKKIIKTLDPLFLENGSTLQIMAIFVSMHLSVRLCYHAKPKRKCKYARKQYSSDTGKK